MRLKCIFAATIVCSAIVAKTHAFDTAGKFGMGIKFWGTPIITFANMKIGLTNAIGLEPSEGYYRWKDEYSYTDPEGEYSYTRENRNSMLIFSLIADIKAIRADRSNFVVKLGGAYARISSSYSYSSTYSESTSSSSSTNFAILGGIGIEHFVNQNFSVNVSTLSSYWISSGEDDYYETDFFFMTFGNQLVDFSLVWYLR